ncbi:hypothetical protein PtA15_2A233 [Puccinia triticina]|uniref:Uncharacterized protein n=1 Tax=Puccinia triticina TaxID=208348 RepID=A0ABY7CDI6_9BASI|nr:uncharacterized protein PtA15_2A233 [Puccinia triticina]WAQ81920.1 hypothetical protein PtA15_2A233 [Puccinia triticina]
MYVIRPQSVEPSSINRSASTSNLKTLNSSDPRSASRLKRLNTETSMRVKSNPEQTVIEVLSNHLSAFCDDEHHACSNLATQDQRRQGILSELRRHPSASLLLTPDDSKSGNDGENKKAETESKPLAYGPPICGYQAEAPGELTTKAGESFKLRSHSKGRYYLERESNVIGSPLSGTQVAFQSQPTTWSGELTNVMQGEKVRVFTHKTRFHWVYCLRESSGELVWLPKWILSANL